MTSVGPAIVVGMICAQRGCDIPTPPILLIGGLILAAIALCLPSRAEKHPKIHTDE